MWARKKSTIIFIIFIIITIITAIIIVVIFIFIKDSLKSIIVVVTSPDYHKERRPKRLVTFETISTKSVVVQYSPSIFIKSIRNPDFHHHHLAAAKHNGCTQADCHLALTITAQCAGMDAIICLARPILPIFPSSVSVLKPVSRVTQQYLYLYMYLYMYLYLCLCLFLYLYLHLYLKYSLWRTPPPVIIQRPRVTQ